MFVIGDLHLSLGEDKPMDIFSGWQDYVQRLEKNWKKIVTDNDTVVIAGDISWAMKLEQTYMDFKFIEDLPGKKIFLKGNHDYGGELKIKLTISCRQILLTPFLYYLIIPMCAVNTLFAAQEAGSLKMTSPRILRF